MCLLAHKWLTSQQATAHPTLSFRAGHPTTNKYQPTKHCHSEPAPYGWAVRRISLWAERVRGYVAGGCWRVRLRGGDSPCLWQAQANAGRQDDTRREDRIALKGLNRPPLYVIHHATKQQTKISPPNTVIQSRPPNSKQGSTHQTLSFRAGPIRMGRAKNLPVGGKGAGVRHLCLLAFPPAGKSSPCGVKL